MEDKKFNTFDTKEQLNKYTEVFLDKLTVGQIQYIGKDIYIWNGTEWEEIEATVDSSGISITMYDLNKQIIMQLPDHNETDVEKDIEIVNDFFEKTHSCYYMMLCKEASYYTIFEKSDLQEFLNLGDAVITCAQDLGKIRSIELLEEEVEIWVYNNDLEEMYCLHLFDYSNGIVTFGG